MSKLQCRKCTCTYFKKVNINEFYNYGGSLYNNLSEVKPTEDVKAYECVRCGTTNLPTLDYMVAPSDRELADVILRTSDGEEVEVTPQIARSRRPTPGYTQTLDSQVNTTDPSQVGTFVRK